jgi:AraC family L-rhamnose operon regulatory protein RhaS
MIPRRTPVPVSLPPHGVYVWESRHDHGFRMPPERHPFAELFYLLDGAGAFVIDRTRHPCCAGDVVVVPPHAEHQIEDESPLTLYGIGVSAHLFAGDPDSLARLPRGRVSGHPPLAARVRGGLRRLLFEQSHDRPGGRTLQVGLALQLVAAVVRGGAGPDDEPPARSLQAVEQFRDELEHRFYEPVGIDRAAAELGMSRRCFTRLFRRAAGCSYAKYVERVRVEYACQLLRETGRSVATIAFECGFEDLSSFYRAFRRQKGRPPHQWRLAAGGAGPNCKPG